MSEIKKWKGKVAMCFLVIRPIKNPEVWENFFRGYEDYFEIYSHISGGDYEYGRDYWPGMLWDNRVEAHGINHVATGWGNVSLVVAEGLLYETALKNTENKYFCLLSESDIPLWSFPDFYNGLKTNGKSYMDIRSGKGDNDMFLDCFPEKYIPSTNRARSRDQRDARKITLRTSHQWKILVRREANEFVDMCEDDDYIAAYENCFKLDPKRLAPDEYAFSNWLVLKHGVDYIKNNIIATETTFADFNMDATHAREFKHITPKIRDSVCEYRGSKRPFFARKFPVGASKLLKELPVRCKRRSGFGQSSYSTFGFRNFGKHYESDESDYESDYSDY